MSRCFSPVVAAQVISKRLTREDRNLILDSGAVGFLQMQSRSLGNIGDVRGQGLSLGEAWLQILSLL